VSLQELLSHILTDAARLLVLLEGHVGGVAIRLKEGGGKKGWWEIKWWWRWIV
jgi:hypothetical protein